MQGSKQMIADFVLSLSQAKNQALNLKQVSAEIEIVLCPPAIYLEKLQAKLKTNNLLEPIFLGAQNVYCEPQGAVTGEISSEMLVDMGCRYVIIGHSERRQLFYEDDTLIAQKFRAAYHAGLTPILCVGETAAERAEDRTFEVVIRQLEAVLKLMPLGALSTSIIAYEPVWAIGTGVTATPEVAETVHRFLRDWLKERDSEVAEKVRLVYGGSVKAENAAGLLAMPNIDGALVGGASLVAAEFLKICESI